jgi:hypothetical protein
MLVNGKVEFWRIFWSLRIGKFGFIVLVVGCASCLFSHFYDQFFGVLLVFN